MTLERQDFLQLFFLRILPDFLYFLVGKNRLIQAKKLRIEFLLALFLPLLNFFDDIFRDELSGVDGFDFGKVVEELSIKLVLFGFLEVFFILELFFDFNQVFGSASFVEVVVNIFLDLFEEVRDGFEKLLFIGSEIDLNLFFKLNLFFDVGDEFFVGL